MEHKTRELRKIAREIKTLKHRINLSKTEKTTSRLKELLKQKVIEYKKKEDEYYLFRRGKNAKINQNKPRKSAFFMQLL